MATICYICCIHWSSAFDVRLQLQLDILKSMEHIRLPSLLPLWRSRSSESSSSSDLSSSSSSSFSSTSEEKLEEEDETEATPVCEELESDEEREAEDREEDMDLQSSLAACIEAAEQTRSRAGARQSSRLQQTATARVDAQFARAQQRTSAASMRF